MTRYHAIPSPVAAIKALWHWWADDTDQHTNIGKCPCTRCNTHLWMDR